MSDPDTSHDRAEGDRIDADHPRPGRPTPYRTGQGHGDDAIGDTRPQAGLTGDDVADASDDDSDDASDDAGRSPNDIGLDADADAAERYRNSPGAGLLRDDEAVPEPNEPA